jgi:hypothetical protein
VSGILDRLESWTGSDRIPLEDLRACIEAPAVQADKFAAQFDTTASLCVLSQLLDGVADAVGTSHAQFVEAIQAIRLGHLRLLARLTAPGGRGLLVTDLVSSETCPDLGSTSEADLPDKLVKLIAGRNFFTGLNPAVLLSLFGSDGVLRAELADAALTPPGSGTSAPGSTPFTASCFNGGDAGARAGGETGTRPTGHALNRQGRCQEFIDAQAVDRGRFVGRWSVARGCDPYYAVGPAPTRTPPSRAVTAHPSVRPSARWAVRSLAWSPLFVVRATDGAMLTVSSAQSRRPTLAAHSRLK